MGVHFWEEPLFESVAEPRLRLNIDESGVRILTPILPRTMQTYDVATAQQRLLDRYMQDQIRGNVVAWYYTPMALQFSGHLESETTVYDCMDELSAFLGAPPELVDWEQKLFRRADVVFTGGASLYAAKRTSIRMCTCFPAASTSSILRQLARRSPILQTRRHSPSAHRVFWRAGREAGHRTFARGGQEPSGMALRADWSGG